MLLPYSGQFTLLEYYQKAIFESYNIVISWHIGFAKRYLSCKDTKVFKDHMQVLRRKIWHFKEAKDYLKQKYKEKYINTIYLDDECEY